MASVPNRSQWSRTRAITLAVVVAALVYQLFLRYEFTHSGALVMRIDHLTASVCEAAPVNRCSTSASVPTSLSPVVAKDLPTGQAAPVEENPFLRATTSTPIVDSKADGTCDVRTNPYCAAVPGAVSASPKR